MRSSLSLSLSFSEPRSCRYKYCRGRRKASRVLFSLVVTRTSIEKKKGEQKTHQNFPVVFFFFMEVGTGADGIQRLLAAETEAQAIVSKARKGKKR